MTKTTQIDKPSRFELNPIIVKELRSRMRGSRAFATLTGILLILAVFSFALYTLIVRTAQYSSIPLSPQVGQALVLWSGADGAGSDQRPGAIHHRHCHQR